MLTDGGCVLPCRWARGAVPVRAQAVFTERLRGEARARVSAASVQENRTGLA